MKKVTLTKFLAYVCIACLSFSLIGCGNQPKSSTPKVEPLKTLRITYVKSPLNIPSIVDKNLETVKKSFAKTMKQAEKEKYLKTNKELPTTK